MSNDKDPTITAQEAGYQFAKTFDPEFVMSGYAVQQEAQAWGKDMQYNFWSGYNKAKEEYLNSL